MIDRLESLRLQLRLAHLQPTPLERRPFALELRRRPQSAPDAGRRPSLAENRPRAFGSTLRDQQGRLARPPVPALFAPRQFRLSSLARGDAETAHRTNRAGRPR